jgi:hypothetical protein
MPDYKVTVEGSDPLPIRASNKDAARNRAVRERVTVEKLTTEDAIAFGQKGVALIIAGEDDAAGDDDSQQVPRVNIETGMIEKRDVAAGAWVNDRPATLAELVEADGPPAQWRVNAKAGMLQRHPGGGADDDDSNWADIREATPDEVAAAKPPKK